MRVSDLIATNRGGYLDEHRVARYVRRVPRGLLWVMEHGGCLYLVDGHHRAVAAFRRGEGQVLAHVIRIPAGRVNRVA